MILSERAFALSVFRWIVSYLSFLLKAGYYFYVFFGLLLLTAVFLSLVGMPTINSFLQYFRIPDGNYKFSVDALEAAGFIALLCPAVGLAGSKLFQILFKTKPGFAQELGLAGGLMLAVAILNTTVFWFSEQTRHAPSGITLTGFLTLILVGIVLFIFYAAGAGLEKVGEIASKKMATN